MHNYKIASTLISLPGEIYKGARVQGIHLVAFNSTQLPTIDEGRNIWAFADNGKFLWKIAAGPKTAGQTGSPWMTFYENENGEVVAVNGLDKRFIVDPANGEISKV